MAGDWIQMRCDLHEDPAVISIAGACKMDEDCVVGKLCRLWSWASRQTRDGNVPGVTVTWIDRYCNVQGFGRAMIEAGWLVETREGICFPKWERHNPNPAKVRAQRSAEQIQQAKELTRLRVQRFRERKRAAKRAESGAECNAAGNGYVTLPLRAREEKSIYTPPTPPPGGARGVTDTPPTPPPDDGFSAFWDAYPKKTREQLARSAWRELAPSPELLAEILAGVAGLKKTDGWTREGGRYVPHAANFLYERRWREGIAPKRNAAFEQEIREQRARTEQDRREREACRRERLEHPEKFEAWENALRPIRERFDAERAREQQHRQRLQG